MSSVNSTTSIAQPRTNRWPAQTNVVVPCASSRPWSSDPTSCWAARPISPMRVVESVLLRSVNDSGGRAPAVVIVNAGMPRATNGPWP